MSWNIRVYDADSDEHKLLELAAALLTVKSPNRYRYYVDECYSDLGQDWQWTTIMCDGIGTEKTIGSWQALSPRDHEMIVLGKVEEAVKTILTDKFNPDKKYK